MSGGKFTDLKSDLYERSPESRPRVAKKVAQLAEDLGLAELRARMEQTQAQLADAIGTTQSGVSRLERQQDLRVSTLRDYIAATGGRLRLIAEYSELAYEIDLPTLRDSAPSSLQPRVFSVVWQDTRTRQLVRVGTLEVSDGSFVFSYTPDAELHSGFEPFPEFPDLRRTYTAQELFPFFAGRIPTSARQDYGTIREALGLTSDEATPIELLARSWGQSPHDTIQVVPEPEENADGSEAMWFLVSGISHAHEDANSDTPDAVTARVARLEAGQEVALRDEPENRFNDRAIRLEVQAKLVGWIPGYLLDYVHKKRADGYLLRVTVDQANGPDLPWHLRLLCRLVVTPLAPH